MVTDARKNSSESDSSLTELLAGKIAALNFESLSDEAIEAAKLSIIDTLAVAWGGAKIDACRRARDAMRSEAGGPASIWAYDDMRLAADKAAFLNAMSAAALDFDALGQDSTTHANIVVLPVVWAMAEKHRLNGKDLITAFIVGADLMNRLGAAAEATGQPHKGWFYTSLHGAIASAAAAGRAMGLDADAIRNAMGLAFLQSGGTQQANIEAGPAKHMQAGFAARSAVMSAEFARAGLSAPRLVLEGQYGLSALYHEIDTERLLRGHGEHFEHSRVILKKYPSCGCNQTSIEATLNLSNTYSIKADAVSDIEVEISPFMNRLVGAPFAPVGDIVNAAQFNIRYSIAACLVRGRFGLNELTPESIGDPVIRRLADRVRVVVDEQNNGRRGPVVLRVTENGNARAIKVVHLPGSAEAPLSPEDITGKHHDCFMSGAKQLTEEKWDLLRTRLSTLEKTEDTASLLSGL